MSKMEETVLLYKISSEHAEAFEEAKKKVKEECETQERDDYTILQFCRANDYDIGRSVQGYKAHMEWKLQYKIETLLEDYTAPEILQTYFPMYILGLDRGGSPILVFELGSTDVNGLLNTVTVEEIITHVLFVIQVGEKYMNDQVEEIKKRKWFVLIDCKDFPPIFATNKTFRLVSKDLAEMCVNNYPERLKTAFIINSTPIIQTHVKFLKQFLPESLSQKVKIFETAEWADHLKELIDPCILPKFFGGKLYDIATFPSITPIVRGTLIPKELFFDHKRNYLKPMPGTVQYTLGQFEKYRVKVQVWQPNTYLKWEFETEIHSIAFGLNYMADDKAKLTVLIPSRRIYAINRTEAGEYLCEEPGIYILLFDNSSSKFTSKKLYYNYSVFTK